MSPLCRRLALVAVSVAASVAASVAVSLLPLTAAADPYVPPALEEWRDWVLHGQQWRQCPQRFDGASASPADRLCVWPGALRLEVDAQGARFEQSWAVFGDKTPVPLPGGAGLWPEAVTSGGDPALVLAAGNRPVLELAPGRHVLRGLIRWQERPGFLAIPGLTGLIELTLDGRRIERPALDGERLFLGEQRRAAVARDELRTELYRLLSDEIPARLTTRIRLDVSGSVREARFGPLLPDGYVPTALSGTLPARFEPDGRLRVQLRPGRWQLTLVARAPGSIDSLVLPVGGENLPDTEILSYEGIERLRVTAAEGLTPLDPERADAPQEWRQFPAFSVAGGDVLEIVERSRGLVGADNELRLERRLWLDFDGDGMLARDRIGGEMRRAWRLDMPPPFELLAARSDGQNLLVTLSDTLPGTFSSKSRGIEIRQRPVDVESFARIGRHGKLPVSGWDSRFTSVVTELNLPPGQRLLAAPGADRARGSWIGQWQLLDMFLVLIVAAAAGKLFGPAAAIVAGAGLVLSYHETGSPVWLWLNLLAALALLRVAPAGRLRVLLRGYFYSGLLLLGVVLVPFAAGQLRVGLYPQLDRGLYPMPGSPAFAAAPRNALGEQAHSRVEPRGRLPAERSEGTVEEAAVTSAMPEPYRVFSRYEPGALVQAGPGIPQWSWNRYDLEWSGPVEAGQAFRLIVAPRWLVSLWRFAAVGLLGLFALYFVAEAVDRRWRPPGLGAAAAPSLAAVLAAVFVPALAPAPAAADIPERELLEELRQRLTAPLPCEPRCADIVAARVAAQPESLDIELDVHASVEVALPVPGLDGDWRPETLTLDARRVDAVARDRDRLTLIVPPGRHTLRLSGRLPALSSVTLPFPEPPRSIDVQARGWTVAGVTERRLVGGRLRLDRRRTDPAPEPAWESRRFPAFVRVLRRIEIGIDWRMTTTVTRVAPLDGALEVSLPLVDGESVLTASLRVDAGRAVVTMGPGQSEVRWESRLPSSSSLTLSADDRGSAVETWVFAIGRIWNIAFEGVPETRSDSEPSGARLVEFRPRPGETLTLEARRPAVAQGDALAIDAAQLTSRAGRRLLESRLAIAYRATRGDQHVLRLPADAALVSVAVQGEEQALELVDGALTLPILPGEHRVEIAFRQARGSGFVTATPEVDLGAPASNVEVQLAPDPSRWLLLTSGPRLGPAVLYWSELLVLALLAVALGRTGLTPLTTRHWFLLGLGFSTFNWPVLALVVGWLLLTALRERWSPDLSWRRFDLLQVAFALLSVLALGAILASLPGGLLGTPDMHVAGNGSSAFELRWFTDRVAGAMPSGRVISLPLWTYQALILAWALWLSLALLRWLPWVWSVFARQGLWRSREPSA